MTGSPRPDEAARRTALEFSLRVERAAVTANVEDAVGRALGCALRPGDHHDFPALVTELLGMKVVLFEWRGRGDRVVLRLEGYVEDARYLKRPDGEPGLATVEALDISVATGDGGSHVQRDHRSPGTHPLGRGRKSALPPSRRIA